MKDEMTKNETKEENEKIYSFPVEEAEKPYKFRRLGSTDIFLISTIISKIGINEFMACLEGDSIKKLVSAFKNNGDKNDVSDDNLYIMGALAGTLEIANVILGNLYKCEKEIYKLLSQTSNLTIEEITSEGNAVMFLEMVIDFIKKDEFMDFIKVVSKLFK